jgi:hypothetical protein
MKLVTFPLDFIGQPPMLEPKHRKLHDLAVQYVWANVQGGSEINLSLFNKVFVCAEVDENNDPVAVHGVTGYGLRVDIPLFRSTNPVATAKLHKRLHQTLADQGMLGQEVFIHISGKESEDQRWSSWHTELEKAGATPADRYKVVVKAV